MIDSSAFFAFAASLSWVFSQLFGHKPALYFGSLQFNRIRMIVASILLLAMIVISGNSWQVSSGALGWIILSGIIGVGLGDYFLFISMERLGPRRTGVLFAFNAPLAAFLAWLLLNEALTLNIIIAIIIGFFGIILAVIYGSLQANTHDWEKTKPPLWLGVGAGLLAAIGQAAGVLLLRPVMEQGTDPLQASLIRVVAAGIFLWAMFIFQKKKNKPWKMPPMSVNWHVIANGFFGLSFGLALFLKALETGQVAKVSMLVAISPVLMLPFIWFQTKKIPAIGAWIGAMLVVLSSWIIIQ
ncbi:DMT family transporter [Alphaproteobacteria bacterium]|nr:DMT family transporter [Alphaproteobacteria bacterium]